MYDVQKKRKYTFVYHNLNTGQNHDIMALINTLCKLEVFRYLEMAVTNNINDEINGRSTLDNAYYTIQFRICYLPKFYLKI
jgi:hypothetical protein